MNQLGNGVARGREIIGSLSLGECGVFGVTLLLKDGILDLIGGARIKLLSEFRINCRALSGLFPLCLPRSQGCLKKLLLVTLGTN